MLGLYLVLYRQAAISKFTQVSSGFGKLHNFPLTMWLIATCSPNFLEDFVEISPF